MRCRSERRRRLSLGALTLRRSLRGRASRRASVPGSAGAAPSRWPSFCLRGCPERGGRTAITPCQITTCGHLARIRRNSLSLGKFRPMGRGFPDSLLVQLPGVTGRKSGRRGARRATCARPASRPRDGPRRGPRPPAVRSPAPGPRHPTAAPDPRGGPPSAAGLQTWHTWQAVRMTSMGARACRKGGDGGIRAGATGRRPPASMHAVTPPCRPHGPRAAPRGGAERAREGGAPCQPASATRWGGAAPSGIPIPSCGERYVRPARWYGRLRERHGGSATDALRSLAFTVRDCILAGSRRVPGWEARMQPGGSVGFAPGIAVLSFESTDQAGWERAASAGVFRVDSTSSPVGEGCLGGK